MDDKPTTMPQSWLSTESTAIGTDGVEHHPLRPFLPVNARVLFLGSFPPQRKRWCMDFYYPNFINDHWRIEGEVFFGDSQHFVVEGQRRFDSQLIVDFCLERGLAFFDTATAVRRLQDNASDKYLEVVEATDVRALMAGLPCLRAVVTTGEKATLTLCQQLSLPAVPKVGDSVAIPGIVNHDGEAVMLCRLPSSSRAYPLAFAKKVEAYRRMFSSVGLLQPRLLRYDMGSGVVAFSTMRQGGSSATSLPPAESRHYATFNINRYCGDSDDHVARNRELLCQLLGIGDDRLIMPHQTHSARVAPIDSAFLALTTGEQQEALEGVDALMTNVAGVCIGVSTADCIPVVLYDPVHRAACAVHAGWRGTVAAIAAKAVAAMAQAYGSQPHELRAQIGPGIGLDSFEVGQEVYDAFAGAGFTMSAVSRRYPARDDVREQRWHIDLPECNRRQLVDAGLMADHIANCAICTYQHPQTFFSARRLGIGSGRIFTAVMLAEAT